MCIWSKIELDWDWAEADVGRKNYYFYLMRRLLKAQTLSSVMHRMCCKLIIKLNKYDLMTKIQNGGLKRWRNDDKPINDAPFVQKLQSTDQLGSIETRSFAVEFLIFLYVEHQVTAIQIFHYKKQMTLKNNINKHTQLRKPSLQNIDSPAPNIIYII